MEYNEALLKALIYETNLRNSEGQFEWTTEWLGWLPFGQYQWLEINNEDISSNGFDFRWDIEDLIKLTDLGLLIKLSEENFPNDKTIIKYKINDKMI
jgi:hypothetical protein